MADNILKTRIKQRIDTAANWANTSVPPLKGEIIIYESSDANIPNKMKIGDGKTTASNLPFITDTDSDGLSAGVRIPESSTNTVGSATNPIYWDNGRPYATTYQLNKTVPANAVFTDTNTKVTSAANHYAPQTDSASAINVDASSTTAATWGTTSLVTGVNLTRDTKGHVTGLTVDSIKMPNNPNTDTTYTAGTGLTLSGTTFNHTNSVSADTVSEGGTSRTLAFGGSFNIPSITYDAQGHITTKDVVTLKLPANPDTGATSIEVTGDGNAITAASYSASTRKITLTKGATYNNYSLPAAGTSLGGVKSGGIATISNGVITAVTGAGNADHATNADVANRVAYALAIQGEGTGISFDGSVAKTVNIKGAGSVSVTGNTSGVITVTGATIPTSLKNPNAITINLNGTTTTYDGSSAKSITINAEALGLSSAMKFGGVVTTLPTSAVAGTVVLKGSKEYVYDTGGNWVELGDEGSHALKTITITAGAGLTGGGTLEANRTIAHSNSITAGSVGAAASPSHGGTFAIPKITYDAQGHITGATTVNITLPADSNTHYTANLYLGASGASSNATSAVSNPYLVLRENSTTRNNIQLKGGTGISVSGASGVATIGHTNSITAATAQGSATGTLTFGGTFTIPTITYDAQGHITGKGTTTLTMPANPNTDTHWTANLITGASATATSNAAATSPYLNLVENGSVRNSHQIVGAGTVSVASDSSGKITITGSAHPTVNNAKITITAQNGIKTSGSFTLNQANASTITLEHTNSVTAGTAKGSSGTLAAGGSFTVPSITYDANGHITGWTTTSYTLPTGVNAGNITQTSGDTLILDCNE